jgi:sporulation protein YlmC with PRC-barrel domain
MKSLKLLFVLVLAFAVILAACEPGEIPETGLETPTPDPFAIDTPTPDPLAPEVTPTPIDVTPDVTPTPVDGTSPAVDVTPTPGDDVTPTPVVEVEGEAWRLSHLLDFTVLDQDCQEVGQVSGLVVDQPTGTIHYLVVELDETLVTEMTETGEATEEEGTEAVANIVLVPWEATTLSAIDRAETPLEATPPPAVGTPAVETPTPGVGTPVVGTPTPEVGTPAAETPTPEVGTPVVGTPTLDVATPAAQTPTPGAGTPVVGTPTPDVGTSAAPAPGVDRAECPGEEDVVILNISRDVVAGAPAFETVPDLVETGWDADLRTYWGEELEVLPVTGPEEATQAIHIESITGLRVVGPGRENYGAVQEIILDTEMGEVTHVILRPGGFLVVEREVYVPIPWDALTFDEAENLFVTNMELDAQTIQRAPHYESLEELPDPMEDPGWDQEIDQFWTGEMTQ